MIKESLFFANDNMTQEEIKKKLKKLDIIYIGGVFAFKITKRKNNNALVTLVEEDDGHFFINEGAPEFDIHWLDQLSELCLETKNIIKKSKKYK